MTYIPHVKVSVLGVVGTGASPAEIFSFGFSLAPFGDAVPAIPDTGTREDCNAAIKAMFGHADSLIHSAARITRIKWALIGPDGKYLAPPAETVENTSGGSTFATHPPQCGIAVSLTGPPAVRRVRGRYFLPMYAGPVQTSDLKTGASPAVGILGRQTLMINAINTQLLDDTNNPTAKLHVAIASQGQTSPVVGPANWGVVEVKVGQVVDTQRRRRNALSETYSTGTVTIP